jgi:hypothetical protein
MSGSDTGYLLAAPSRLTRITPSLARAAQPPDRLPPRERGIRATRWARDLGVPRGGETVLYTGMMYQLVPYIEHLVALEQRLGGTPLARLSGLARRVNRLISLVSLAARPSRAERAEADRVPATVARAAARGRGGVRLPVLR